MSKTYFLPIKSNNISHYFVLGCIIPTKYINSRYEDLQNHFTESLILTKQPFTDNTDSALEIVLNSSEEPVMVTKDFLIFDKPIPISRVKKVIFNDEHQAKRTISGINISGKLIPEKIVSIQNIKNQLITKPLEDVQKSNNHVEDISQEIETFNKLMGGFSLIRLSRRNPYPDYYFFILSYINDLVKEELINQSIKISEKFKWLILGNQNYVDLKEAIFSEIDDSTIEHFSKNENIRLQKGNGVYNISTIKDTSSTYLIALIGSHGDNKRFKIDNFIESFISGKFSKERKEGFALSFGINKGYSKFQAEYRIDNKTSRAKFELNSQLDYYTIESIYQYVFNGKTNSTTFDYIDEFCPKKEVKTNFKGYRTIEILDSYILRKEEEEVVKENDFDNIFNKVPTSNLLEAFTNEFQKFIPDFLKESTQESINHHVKSILDIEIKKYAEKFYQTTLQNSNTSIPTKEKEIKQIKKSLNKSIELPNNDKSKNTILLFDKEKDQKIDLTENQLNDMKVTELRKYAKNHKINIRSIKKKADIIRKILNR